MASQPSRKTRSHVVRRTPLTPLALALALDAELDAARFKDYCPNGLQIEGSRPIGKLVSGVTASLALIEAAIEAKADAVLVHHGLFWKNDDGRLIGWRRERIARVIESGLSVFAYHLPLDSHPTMGNNACLGKLMGVRGAKPLATEPLVMQGRLARTLSLGQLGAALGDALERKPLVLGEPDTPVRTVAWCTGGGQNLFEAAINADADVYVTGEVSEQHTHLARETGVGFIAAGHHATERFGVQAVGAWVAKHFGLTHRFIDVDNPV